MTDFAPTTVDGLLTLWDFNKDSKSTVADQAPTGGFENGELKHGAEADKGLLELDGKNDYMVAKPDADWQALDEGRIELVFNQDDHVGSSPDTLLSRDSSNNDDGGHLNIVVTKDGKVQVRHQDESKSYFYETPKDFFEEGDDVRVTYAWDSEGNDGFFKVEVLDKDGKAEKTFEEEITDKLTLNNGSTSEPFTVGAGQTNSGDNTENGLNEYFEGEIAYVAIFDQAAVVASDSVGPDFVVEGTDDGELIDAAYDGDPEGDMIDAGDSQTGENDDVVDAGAGDDTVLSGDDSDTVFAGSGDDSVKGGGGDDVIYGDSSLGQAGTATERESFEWDKLNASDLNNNNGSVQQDTGNVNVTFTIASDSDVLNGFEDSTQNVDGIDTGSETIDNQSSFESVLNGQSNDATYTFGFDAEVENVSFRINDIDGDGIVRVTAMGPDGPVEVELTAGADLTKTDPNTVDSNGGYQPDDSPNYSVLVEIPGPVTSIKIEHDQDGGDNTGINITDVYFDAPVDVAEGPGDDILIGGGGADLIYGETGDDSIEGNSGNDTLFGDDPAEGTPIGPNLIVNGSFEDTTGATATGYGFRADDGIPGWTEDTGEDFDIHDDGRGNVDPTDGTNWLDLDRSPGNVRVGQDVQGVQDGESYLLTFDAGDADFSASSGAGENEVNVYWGAELVGIIDPGQGTMTQFEFELEGGAGDGTNRLEFEGTGTEDNFGASIDSVSLVQLAGPEGSGGNDTIDGGTGADVIDGQDGSDNLVGGDGDDTIIGGSGDDITGGEGSDSIKIDADALDETGENNGGFTVDGSTEGTDDDTLDLTAFEAFRNLNETADGDDVPSTSGSVEVRNGDGEWVTVTFAEIENLLLPPVVVAAPNGVVDGEETGEVMNPGYDDSGQATDGGGDIIDGADGLDDSIRGNGGDDTINAGQGNDSVEGGTGNDDIFGNDGSDTILGGDGDDSVRGGDGDDELRGNLGNDTLEGGQGNDSMGGAEGDDSLVGGQGENTLTGGSGDDTLEAGSDADTLTGGSGNDVINGGQGDNLVNAGILGTPDQGFPETTISGGPLDGTVIPAVPADTLFSGAPGEPFGGPDDDRDNVTTGGGNDTISTGDDDDTINAGNGDNEINAGFDDDIITSGTGNDTIISGEGNDTISSGFGDDLIYGGVGPAFPDVTNVADNGEGSQIGPDPLPDNGDDLINAGGGNDRVFGEDDDDTIFGGQGSDFLDGGVDQDSIEGGDQEDTIIGGQGADILKGQDDADTFIVGQTFPGIEDGIGDTIIGGEGTSTGVDDDTLDLSGAGPLRIIYEDSIDPAGTSGESGRVVFYEDADKTIVAGELTFSEIENVIPCFTPGALIATPQGEVPVESLKEGDKVITRDNGIQEIRWAGRRTLNRDELARAPNMRPILIKAGSLGEGLPERDMVVSPQHRVLVSGQRTQLYFDESEVLVAAKHLLNAGSIQRVDTLRTTYIHFMFDRHEVVLSDGAWTESFQPGDQSLGGMGQEQRDEILALFPELATKDGLSDYAAARRALKSHEARLLQL